MGHLYFQQEWFSSFSIHCQVLAKHVCHEFFCCDTDICAEIKKLVDIDKYLFDMLLIYLHKLIGENKKLHYRKLG